MEKDTRANSNRGEIGIARGCSKIGIRQKTEKKEIIKEKDARNGVNVHEFITI